MIGNSPPSLSSKVTRSAPLWYAAEPRIGKPQSRRWWQAARMPSPTSPASGAPSAPETLLTPRLRLARFSPGDAATLTALYSKPEVMQYIVPGGRTPEQSAAAVKRLLTQWEQHGFGAWMLHLREPAADAYVGVAMLMREPTGEVEVGYALDQPHWGQGLAGEAASAAVRVGLEALGLPGLFARVDAENTPSARVLLRLGFVCAKHTRSEQGRETDWYLREGAKGETARLPPSAG